MRRQFSSFKMAVLYAWTRNPILSPGSLNGPSCPISDNDSFFENLPEHNFYLKNALCTKRFTDKNNSCITCEQIGQKFITGW